jgi:hypothetical protein
MSKSKAGMQTIRREDNLYGIVYRNGKGSVPKALRGGYTSRGVAQKVIDNFYASAKGKAK